jgi:hypothetical protein
MSNSIDYSYRLCVYVCVCVNVCGVQVAHALLLLLYCFITVLPLTDTFERQRAGKTLQAMEKSRSCFTAAAYMLYCCCLHALLLLRYCCITALLQTPQESGCCVHALLLLLYCITTYRHIREAAGWQDTEGDGKVAHVLGDGRQ